MGQYGLLVLLGIIVIIGLILVIIVSFNKPTRKLLNLTRKLTATEVTNDKADQLIGLLMSIKSMPKKRAYCESIKTANKQIEQSVNVDLESKQKIRTLLLGLGVV